MLVSFNWLKEYLGETKLTAEEATELLGVHAFEIEGIEEKGDDTVIDVDVLPNRSSDCLCHLGIAQEIAVITNTKLANDPLQGTVELPDFENIEINITDRVACPRFSASLVTGIEVKESPDWLKERLTAIGQRPINNIVDATNYVMFALGQPIHAYDAELFPQVNGQWKFDIRFAKEGETVSLIPEGGKDKVNAGGKEGVLGQEERVVECQGTELLIVDGSSNTPIGLAGVKGGSFAGVHKGTTQVIIETAHFHPTITRKTARRLGIVIDASKRFENEPSRELIPFAQKEICELIVKIAGGEHIGWTDVYLERQEPVVTNVSLEKINSLLGLPLGADEVESLLRRISADVRVTETGFLVVSPFERTDLQIEEDYIEEVGRLYGYSHIEAIPPEKRDLTELNKRHYYAEQIRKVLLDDGFSEVITSSFRKKDKVQLRNSLASDKSCLRSNLTENITEALDKNANFTDLLGTTDTRIFEIGTVFYPGENGVSEHVSLAIGVRNKVSGYSGKEDKVIADILETLSGELNMKFEGRNDKGVVEINLSSLFEQVPGPQKYEAVEVGEEIAYSPFSTYPHMSRDIAMWVKEDTTPEKVEEVLNANAGDLRVRTTKFDEFAKDGRLSLGFRLVFQSMDKTLTDEEVNVVMATVYEAVEKQGWEVR